MDEERVLERAVAWRAAGRRVALATVVATWGSAPRPVGSHLAIDDEGRMVGSVSGGCIEGAVAFEAAKVLEDGEPRVLSFGVTNEMAWEVGLACGGRVRVYLEPLEGGGGAASDLVERLLDARGQSRAVALVTDLTTGLRSLVFDDAVHGGFGLTDGQLSHIRHLIAIDDSRLIGVELEGDQDGGHHDGCEAEETPLFVRVFNPPPRLIIVGAVHIAQPLAAMAEMAGYAVRVVDPRRRFATPERFPGVTLVEAWPDEALSALEPDHRTAVVTLTHDPKLDDPALRVALRSPAFYVGALGSTRTQAQRVSRLAGEGVTAAEIARLRAPVGMAIGAKTPAEIAVAILAEIISVRRGR